MRKSEILLVFVLGALTGAGLTYYEMNQRMNAELEDIAIDDEEPVYDYEKRAAILDAKNEDAYIEEMENMTTQEIVDRLNNIIQEDDPDPAAVKKLRDGKVVNMLAKNYKSDEGPKRPVDYSRKSGEAVQVNVGSDMPYLIGKGDFEDEAEVYDKVTLFFYPVDAVLVDEHEHIIENQETFIDSTGYAQVDDFHDVDEDRPAVFYIRNDVTTTDFSIFWLEGESFEDAMTTPPRG